ncbi:leucine-rich repeat protein [Periweissella cryptocerci]|nr:leucine-rich repeat protein [Periweissella cryptocerci]
MTKTIKRHKQLLYTSLATMTLASSMGPSVLVSADTLSTTDTVQVDHNLVSDTDASIPLAPATLSDSTNIMPPLPSPQVIQPAAPIKKSIANKASSATDSPNTAKKNTLTAKPVTRTKQSTPTAKIGSETHVFTRDELDITGTTINGFNAAGMAISESPDWDGALTFAPELNDITVIADSAFADYAAITSIDFSTLPNLISIGAYAFDGLANVTSIELANLNHLVEIGKGAFATNTNLTSLTFENLPELQTIGSETFYYDIPLATVRLVNLPKLTFLGDYNFNFASVKEITVGNLNPQLVLGDHTFASNIQLAGIVFPSDTSTSSIASAQTFVDYINEYIDYTDDYSEDEHWTLGGTMTYKFIDDNDNIISSLTPITFTGRVGESYDLPEIPTVPGYGAVELVSTITPGTFLAGPNELVYKYSRTKAAPFSIYYVDANDKEIAPTQTFDDSPDIMLTLSAQSIDGYTFKELYGSKTPTSRAVSDFEWAGAHELIDTSISLGDNAGRSYKFVYDENVTGPDTNNPGETGKTENTPQATEPIAKPTNPTPATPTNTDKNPVSDTDKTPANKLPGTGGGDSTGKKNAANNSNKTQHATNTEATKSDTMLPKSGSIQNYLLPVLGAMLTTSLVALYAFKKKRNH